MDISTKTVVVGFDGSDDGARALRWAAALASRTGAALRVVIARGDLHTLSSWADEWTRGLAEEWTDTARKILQGVGRDGDEVVVREGQPTEVLVGESADAGLLVLGSRGHGKLSGALLGSVSRNVARHAVSPVIVVRGTQQTPGREVVGDDLPGGPIVVGVDGSNAGFHALRFALAIAGPLDRPVQIVFCTDQLRAFGEEWEDELSTHLREELRRREQEVLDTIEKEVERHPEVRVDTQVTRAHPEPLLLDASREASLVVVGSKGHSALSEILMGSVSAEVLARADCPVAVAR